MEEMLVKEKNSSRDSRHCRLEVKIYIYIYIKKNKKIKIK